MSSTISSKVPDEVLNLQNAGSTQAPCAELTPFVEVRERLARALGDRQAIDEVVHSPGYGELMHLLWEKSQSFAKSQDPEAKRFLTSAASWLSVEESDLLYDLPEYLLPDVSTFVPGTIVAGTLSSNLATKPKGLPPAKEVDSIIETPYSWLKFLAPKTKSENGIVRSVLRDLAKVVASWSRGMCSDVHERLREVATAMEKSGLTMADFKDLPDQDLQLIASIAKRVQGSCVDADHFVTDVHADATDRTWVQRMEDWGSDRCADMGNVLGSIAKSIELFRDPDAWDKSRVIFGVAAGVGVHGHLPGPLQWMGAHAAGCSFVNWVMPTLGELKNGKAKVVRMVGHAASGALPMVGISKGADPRGSFGGVTTGRFVTTQGPTYSDSGMSIPGIMTMSIGRDQAYGPYMFFGPSVDPASIVKLIPFWGAAAATVVSRALKAIPILRPFIGASAKWFHEGLGPIEHWVREIMSPLPVAANFVKGRTFRVWQRLSGATDKQGQAAHWPSDADWKACLPVVATGEAGIAPAKSLTDVLKRVTPEQLVGSEFARGLLGKDADDPRHTYDTICDFVKKTTDSLETNTKRARELAAARLAGKEVSVHEIENLADKIRRQTYELCWICSELVMPLLKGP